VADEENENKGDARTWSDEGWTAVVMKNEDDEGWAVAMTQEGQSEPALVSPWTMGRDKKNPKPLNTADFKTLLKAARDVVTRHAASERARLHRSFRIEDHRFGALRIALDVVPDEDDPHALLTAWDGSGDRIAERRVVASFALTSRKAADWAASDFGEVLFAL